MSITADLYGHLTPEIATSAADTFGAALEAARVERAAERAVTIRPRCAQTIQKLTLRALRYRKPRSSDMAHPKGLEPLTF